ncbi:CaiB/BaiF CoA transferase family protein [Novosphingobium sp. BL-52-GroH]|uniref:CaiB/BaiF CoA transferase family protein n=1 Tax=Novosphingobium sp. BL-52-GroH TaxID=3349877 RepID=UPI00384F8008
MMGPLHGIRIIEMGGIGPAPFACMLLADLGAEVIRVDRPGGANQGGLLQDYDVLARSRSSIVLDIKASGAIEVLHDLVRGADAFVEGFRPGVAERLGLGPEALLAVNPALVYGRITGWGQDGPLAATAGHDLTYIAISGNLHGYGRAGGKPTPATNAVGDFGGGGMLLVAGLLSALFAARASGSGQVVDVAMADGAALLSSMFWGMLAQGTWRDDRGVNLLDTGAPFYDTYETADGRFVAIAPIEPQFYAQLRGLAGIADDPDFDDQFDERRWPIMRDKLAAIFATRTRDEWEARFAGSDACLAPVLSMDEAPRYPHNLARGAFVDVAGIVQPAPAPRFSATPLAPPRPPRPLGADGESVLLGLGYTHDAIASLAAEGVFGSDQSERTGP